MGGEPIDHTGGRKLEREQEVDLRFTHVVNPRLASFYVGEKLSLVRHDETIPEKM